LQRQPLLSLPCRRGRLRQKRNFLVEPQREYRTQLFRDRFGTVTLAFWLR
jgi:hypothetical protein